MISLIFFLIWEILQRRGKYCNAVGNIATTFLPLTVAIFPTPLYWANTNYIEKSNKQRISNLLQNETDHKKNGLLVTGALGSGKTAFLTELCYPGCGGNFSRIYTKILNEKKSGQNRLGPFSILCIINSPQLRGTALGVWDPYSNLFRFFTISRTFFNDQFSKW